MPIHLGPCRTYPCSRTSHRGSRLSPEPVGGGEAVPRRGLGGPWLGRPLRRLTVSRARKVARIVSITPPPATTSRAQWGCIGAPNGATDERCRTGRRLGERAAQEPRGAPGDWHPKT